MSHHPQIAGVPTAVTAFVGRAASGPSNSPVACGSFVDYQSAFGGHAAGASLAASVEDYFANGGSQALVVSVPLNHPIAGNEAERTGIYALTEASLFNLLVIPDDGGRESSISRTNAEAAAYCRKRRAFLLCDPPASWLGDAKSGRFETMSAADSGVSALEDSRYAAVFFPRIRRLNPVTGSMGTFSPTGAVAGQYALSDATHGVWKAPAGTTRQFYDVSGFEFDVTSSQSAVLDARGINVLRTMIGIGPVLMGARTIRGGSASPDDYRYVNVARVALYLESSIVAGLQWTVFETNGPALWSEIRDSVTSFLRNLYNEGAFQSPARVVCDATTNTAADIAAGSVNLLIGIAPSAPNQFVFIKIGLRAA